MAKKRGGAGITEALWTGTAVFAATKSKSYTGFITSVVIYGVILLAVLAAAKWAMGLLGIQMKEGFETGAFNGTCPDGKPPVTRNGSPVCETAAGNATVLTEPAGVGSA